MRIPSSFIVHCSWAIVWMIALSSCTTRQSDASDLEQVPLRYSTNLTCERGDGYSVWTLRNPWDTTQVLHRYLLIPAEPSPSSPTPDPSPKERGVYTSENKGLADSKGNHALLLGRGVGGEAAGSGASLIPVPVRRAGVATAVHCGLLEELGVASAIAGVCEKEYIDLPAVTEGLAAGRIADFGNGMNPNIERIMDVAPDVLLLTPFEHSGGYGRVERLGIPIIECAEYMEVSPLARAEWIRFYGELFGVADKADSIFHAVETSYLSLKEKVAESLQDTSIYNSQSTILNSHTPSRADCALADSSTFNSQFSIFNSPLPRLLTEMLYGGQWFVPCGQSTMGIMFADAGADYIFRNRQGSGSTALSFETVLDEAQDADIWLLKYNSQQPLTYRQLTRDYQPYTRFRAFRERHIYGCDLAHNHFYEETPFHPDRLLRDLIILLHPDLMPGQSPVYYHPLAE